MSSSSTRSTGCHARSTDFARIVEVFDKHNVSFVSVTQQFNTTTSMGRLTLNILLSFAQFEREVIGERIRDKFAASRAQGHVDGRHPAARLRRRRPQAGGERDGGGARPAHLQPLPARSARRPSWRRNCAAPATRRNRWTTQDGKHRPGKPIDKGAIYKILGNRIYLGEAVHKGTSYPGEHEAIIDRGDLGQGARHPRREYGRSRATARARRRRRCCAA